MDCGPKGGRVTQVWAPILLWAPFPTAGSPPGEQMHIHTFICSIVFQSIFIISFEWPEMKKLLRISVERVAESNKFLHLNSKKAYFKGCLIS